MAKFYKTTDGAYIDIENLDCVYLSEQEVEKDGVQTKTKGMTVRTKAGHNYFLSDRDYDELSKFLDTQIINTEQKTEDQREHITNNQRKELALPKYDPARMP